MRASHQASDDRIDVVIIDDEQSIRDGCRQALESEGYHAVAAQDGTKGLQLLESVQPRLVLLDLRMPGISGIEVLERLPSIDPRIVPIVITGYGTVETAVSAMKLGAFEFISKPFDPDQLLSAVERGMHRWTAFDPKLPVTARAPVEPPPPRNEGDVLLKGLEAIAEMDALGTPGGDLRAELRALEVEAEFHAKRLGQVSEKKQQVAELLDDLRLVDQIVARHGFKKNALIQVLLDVQAVKNWLPRHTLTWISRRLGLPMTRILEVATFYAAFSLEPQGKHTVQVCTGTACHVRRAPELSAMVSATLGLKPGETDPQMDFTLKHVNCMGCCALGPVLKVDETYHSNPSLKQMQDIFRDCRGQKKSQGGHHA